MNNIQLFYSTKKFVTFTIDEAELAETVYVAQGRSGGGWDVPGIKL